MWLNSLHKFHRGVMTLISSWKGNIVDGWMGYETSIAGDVSGEQCFYSVMNLLWRSAPVRSQSITQLTFVYSRQLRLRHWK